MRAQGAKIKLFCAHRREEVGHSMTGVEKAPKGRRQANRENCEPAVAEANPTYFGKPGEFIWGRSSPNQRAKAKAQPLLLSLVIIGGLDQNGGTTRKKRPQSRQKRW